MVDGPHMSHGVASHGRWHISTNVTNMLVNIYRTSDIMFNWSMYDPAPATYMPWGFGQPQNTADGCVMPISGFGWFVISCLGEVFDFLICRSDEPLPPLTGMLSFVVNFSAVTYTGNASFFTVDAPNASTMLYGASVQSSIQICQPADRFWPEAGRDAISVTQNAPCIIMLAGVAAGAEYDVVMSGLIWRTQRGSSLPANLTFSTVFWTTRGLCDLVADQLVGSYYTPLRMTNRVDDLDPLLTPGPICALFNATTAYLLTQPSAATAAQTSWNATLMLGATGNGGNFWWSASLQPVAWSIGCNFPRRTT